MVEPRYPLWKRGFSKQYVLQQLFKEGDDFKKAGNATQMFVKGFIDDESKSVRTSMIVLGVFNVLAALVIALIILRDSYKTSKRLRPKTTFYKFCVHSADTLPLIIVLCSFIQGIIFIGAQATGLSSLFVNSCTTISQFVLPAMLLVPYVQVVFGVECAIRALKKTPFASRKRFTAPVLLGVVLLMLISTSLPTWIRPQRGSCFASLAWFVWRYGPEGLILVVLLLAINSISAGIIFYRLTTITTIDQQERIAASRMVYYHLATLLQLILLMPWFVSLVIELPTMDTGMVATATLNLHGLTTAVLQIFLRSNTAAMAILPRGLPSWGRRGQLRIWGPNELGFDAHLLEPVSGPRTPDSTRSTASSRINEKQGSSSMESARNLKSTTLPKEMEQVAKNSVQAGSGNLDGNPSMPEVAVAPHIKKYFHQRKQSYSLFPQEVISQSASTQQGLPSETPALNKPGWDLGDTTVQASNSTRPQQKPQDVVYAADDMLLLPPPLRFMGGSLHRRDSSMGSSATVQIGLRLSNVADDLPETSSLKKNSLALPLRLQTTNLVIPANPAFHPSPLQRSATTGSPMSPISPYLRAARMKTLPPIPRGSTASALAEVHAKPKLSPTVYSPQSTQKVERSPSRDQTSSFKRLGTDCPKAQARVGQGSWI